MNICWTVEEMMLVFLFDKESMIVSVRGLPVVQMINFFDDDLGFHLLNRHPEFFRSRMEAFILESK